MTPTHTDLLFSDGGKEAAAGIVTWAESLRDALENGERVQAWRAFMNVVTFAQLLQVRVKIRVGR